MIIIGHRGACALEPENTLRSIQRAIELGVDMIEIDIYQIEDQLILIHDENLERTTNGKGKIYDHSFDQLRLLDAGKGERIPTLDEVLELTQGKVPLNIEIKGPSLLPLLLETIQEEKNLLLSSFDWQQLRQLRKLAPTIPIGVLGDDGFALAKELNAISIHPALQELSAEYVNQAKSLDLLVYPYTVRTDTDWKLVNDLNVDGCFLDDPFTYHSRAL